MSNQTTCIFSCAAPGGSLHSSVKNRMSVEGALEHSAVEDFIARLTQSSNTNKFFQFFNVAEEAPLFFLCVCVYYSFQMIASISGQARMAEWFWSGPWRGFWRTAPPLLSPNPRSTCQLVCKAHCSRGSTRPWSCKHCSCTAVLENCGLTLRSLHSF